MINSQISAIDKTGLSYDSQMNKSDLNDIHVNESEVLNNVVDSHESDGDDNQVNDRFKKDKGYHAVPLPYTGNYMPPRADLSFAGLDNSVFKFKKLGDGFEFKKKTCFVCGSINHLIKDYDFYENKMVLNNKGKITGSKEIRPVWDNTTRVNHQNKLTHSHPKRNFVPAAVLTKSRQVLVNATKQSSHRVATSVSAARHFSTVASRPNVNNALPTTYSYFNAHSPVRRPFNKKSAAKTNNFNEKVNTAKVNNVTTTGPKVVVSAAEGNRNNDVKSSACWIWRPKGNLIDHISKDSGSYTLKRFNYVDLQGRLKSIMAWVLMRN
nr:ribonuclease H-like domain-containing protein [Tanacetum cinerariifolium]